MLLSYLLTPTQLFLVAFSVRGCIKGISATVYEVDYID